MACITNSFAQSLSPKASKPHISHCYSNIKRLATSKNVKHNRKFHSFALDCETNYELGTEITRSGKNVGIQTPELRVASLDNVSVEMSCETVFFPKKLLLTSLAFAVFTFGATGSASAVDFSELLDLTDFQNGFLESLLLIIFAEIGDKTFFIAALLAARQSNVAVFTGTFGALAVMTVISVFLGRIFHFVDESFPILFGNGDLPLDDIAAVILLLYFGISTLSDAFSMEGSKADEEKQEAEIAIASVGSSTLATTIASVFALVFVAEWGDKSFFSTIALAAASSPVGVVGGAVVGHGLATLLAVLGGSFLSSFVSEKAIAYIGGSLFLIFAAGTSVEIWNKLL